MKKLVILLIALSLVCVDSAFAARVKKASKPTALKACSKVEGVNQGYIYKNSAPLRSGGPGTPLVGYRKEPTLIMMKRLILSRTATVYDSKGNNIGSCPWASAHDTVSGRYRCTMSTSGLRSSARKKTGSPRVFFKVNSKTCVEIPDAGRCYGSSKGLCTQLIS